MELESEHSIVENRKSIIEQIFIDTFPELEIYIQGRTKISVVGKFEKVLEYVRNCECFDVTIKQNIMTVENLKYPDEYNCSLRGKDILIRLYSIAYKLDLEKIVLYDLSKLILPETRFEQKLEIDMATYYILLYGESWYNTLGYYQYDYNKERSHNLKQIHTEFRVNKMHIPGQEIYIDPVFNGEDLISVNKIMKTIDPILKQEFHKIDSRDHPLYRIVTFLTKNVNVKYSNSLHLDVHDPRIIALYEDLESV